MQQGEQQQAAVLATSVKLRTIVDQVQQGSVGVESG